MNYSRIYVTNYAGHDLSHAFRFTALSRKEAQVNLTEGNVDIFDITRLIYTIKQKIRQSNKDDFLLLSGSIILNCIAFSQWLERHGMVNLLIYNSKERCYTLRKITHMQMFVDL
jgi:hypothetical protein